MFVLLEMINDLLFFNFIFRFCELVSSALTADSTHRHPLTELPDQVTEYEYEQDEKTGKTCPRFSPKTG